MLPDVIASSRCRAHATVIYPPSHVGREKRIAWFHACGSLPIVVVIRTAVRAAESPLKQSPRYN